MEWRIDNPLHRKETQQKSRQLLSTSSNLTHASMTAILQALPDEVVKPALEYPGFIDIMDVPSLDDELKHAIVARIS